jgi:2-polyprenyl-6-methoxyphenol hydroxylase-like FAD-dependent oxidoreductase
MREAEIVIVGGGIAGNALATVLARVGHSVVVLERELEYTDQVRGEFIALWGLAEAAALDLMEVLRQAGGFHTPRAVAYDENAPLERAEAAARDLSNLLPGVPGPMCCGHPAMCTALGKAAEAAGATVLKGVNEVQVSAGAPPAISFKWMDRAIAWRPRLIVGADGRNSVVRRQLGIALHRDAAHNFIGGMLVDGVSDWPTDTFSIGTEGDLQYFVFPQGGGRLRLYAAWSLEQRQRFAGPERKKKVLAAFGKLQCLRHAELIAAAKPIGPFNTFFNEDQWTDDPTLPGVVLIGDAAGFNDPVAGQGLSIAFRDVRMLRDALSDGDFSHVAFGRYAIERAERMRRLRVAAHLIATLRVEFGEEPRQRRALALRRAFGEGWPSPLPAALIGPEKLPPGSFEQATIRRLLSN